MVMYAPGGLASLIMMNLRVAKFGKWTRLLPGYAGLAVAAALTLAGAAALIEMLYHLQLNAALGPKMPFLGLTLDAQSAVSWAGAAVLLAAGAALLVVLGRRFGRVWGQIAAEIDLAIRAQESRA